MKKPVINKIVFRFLLTIISCGVFLQLINLCSPSQTGFEFQDSHAVFVSKTGDSEFPLGKSEFSVLAGEFFESESEDEIEDGFKFFFSGFRPYQENIRGIGLLSFTSYEKTLPYINGMPLYISDRALLI